MRIKTYRLKKAKNLKDSISKFTTYVELLFYNFMRATFEFPFFFVIFTAFIVSPFTFII